MYVKYLPKKGIRLLNAFQISQESKAPRKEKEKEKILFGCTMVVVGVYTNKS